VELSRDYSPDPIVSYDGDRYADYDGVPDLGFDCRFSGPIELIELPDPHVQFDPSEEEFHLPSAFVKLGDATAVN